MPQKSASPSNFSRRNRDHIKHVTTKPFQRRNYKNDSDSYDSQSSYSSISPPPTRRRSRHNNSSDSFQSHSSSDDYRDYRSRSRSRSPRRYRHNRSRHHSYSDDNSYSDDYKKSSSYRYHHSPSISPSSRSVSPRRDYRRRTNSRDRSRTSRRDYEKNRYRKREVDYRNHPDSRRNEREDEQYNRRDNKRYRVYQRNERDRDDNRKRYKEEYPKQRYDNDDRKMERSPRRYSSDHQKQKEQSNYTKRDSQSYQRGDTDQLRNKQPITSQQNSNARASKDRSWLDEQKDINGNPESLWKRRRRMREAATCSPIWGSSPSPPHRLEDRFEVGADERRKRERKRKRKEERRARREARRTKKLGSSEKPPLPLPIANNTTEDKQDEIEYQENEKLEKLKDNNNSSDEETLGPSLPQKNNQEQSKPDYGKALRPGEGSKMAAFIKDGARIPRRGEIGLTSNEISAYESQGYVMSGSRNRRMEAVRLRKENQVYSAEELAALQQFDHEEKKIREEKVLNQFRMLVESKLGSKDDQDENGE